MTTSPRMFVGAAYYPDPADATSVTREAERMRQAGFNVARLGDLVWDLMEPEDGVFTLRWMTETVEILGHHGISSFIATPTAAIPRWMYRQHPDILQVTATGERKPFGKRRHACLNHPRFHDFSVRIATRLAEALRNSPRVIAVQIDNELMAEDPHCYCDHCQRAFAGWLESRYGTVERLNEAWGLWFWSQRLSAFSDITLPRKGDSPSAYAAYLEFASDTAIGYYRLQREAIKAVRPDWPVTTNICSSGFLYHLDLYRLGQSCEVMAIDQYPYGWTLENEYGNRGAFTFSPHMTSLALAQLRGAKRGTPFWVTEAQIGRTCGNQRKLLEPGIIRLWSLQEVAQGATGICFFPWKPFAAGHEHVMGAVLDADDIPRRRFHEARGVAEETAALRQLTGQTMPVARACVLRDYRCDWAFDDGRICMDFRYLRNLHLWYRALRRAGVGTDVLHPQEDLAGYDLIIVPALVLVDEALCAALEAAAARGATIVLTAMTGLHNHDGAAFGPYVHSRLTALAGLTVEEQLPLFAQEDTGLTWSGDDSRDRCYLWHDVVTTTTAETLAAYGERFFAGTPVVTRNRVGEGTVFYVGSVLDEAATARVITHAIANAGIVPVAISDHDQVEVTEVAGPEGRFLYALNFSDQARPIRLHRPAWELTTGLAIGDEIVIPAMDARIFRLG